MWVHARAAIIKGHVSSVPSGFGDGSYSAVGNRLARASARYARGPGFESLPDHVLPQFYSAKILPVNVQNRIR